MKYLLATAPCGNRPSTLPNRHCAMMLAFFVILSANSVAAEPTRRPWATVTKAPNNNRYVTTLDFGTLGPARNSNRIDGVVYYAKRTYKPLTGAPQVQWTDSVSCPALQTALGGLRSVPPPKIDVPGYPSQKGGFWENVTLDGTGYGLDMAPHLTFSTNDENSALPKWTERTLRDLDSCWHDEAPADTDAVNGGNGLKAAIGARPRYPNTP